MNIKKIAKFALAGGAVATASAGAFAAQGVGAVDGVTANTTDFDEVWELLVGWTQGALGKVLALGALILGIGFGLVRQSVAAAAVGLGMAIVLQYGPYVINQIIGADAVPVAVAQFDNGLE